MVAACFYSKEEYEKLLSLSDDRKTMCDTYDEWLYQFMKMKNVMADQKVIVTPVFIKISELQKWCKQNKIKNNSTSRSKYVLSLTQKL